MPVSEIWRALTNNSLSGTRLKKYSESLVKFCLPEKGAQYHGTWIEILAIVGRTKQSIRTGYVIENICAKLSLPLKIRMLVAIMGGRPVVHQVRKYKSSESSRVTDTICNLASAMWAESTKTHKTVPNQKYFPNRQMH